MYSMLTSPLVIERRPPGNAQVGGHVGEQADVHVLEHAVAHVVCLGGDQFLGHSRPQADGAGEVLALHHLLDRQRGDDVQRHPGIVAFAVSRRAFDQRLVPADAGLLRRLRDVVDVAAQRDHGLARSPACHPRGGNAGHAALDFESLFFQEMPVRYLEVSNSWKPSSPKLNTLSTMTCACFFMASIWPARSAFMAASFSGVMFGCPRRARAPRAMSTTVFRIGDSVPDAARTGAWPASRGVSRYLRGAAAGSGAGGPKRGLAGAGLRPRLFDFLGKAGDQALDPGGNFGDDGRVLRGNIVGFRRVLFDVVQLRLLQRQIDSAARGRGAIREAVVARDVELPLSPARALQVPAIEIEQGFAFQAWPRGRKQGPDIDSVDGQFRQGGARQARHRGQHVDGPGDAAADRSARNASGEARQKRFAHAAFIGGAFAPAQLAGAALIPRSVVRGEHHQRAIVEALFLEFGQDFADAPIEFLHHVAVQAERRLAAEALRRRQRNVGEGVRHVEEEGRVLGALDELKRLLGVARRQGLQHRGLLEGLGVVHQGPRGHVVGVGDAEVFVEAALRRQVLRLMAEVPLADAHGLVALRFQQGGERGLGLGETGLIRRHEHVGHAGSGGVAAGEQRRPRRGANGIGGIELREAHALRRHAVQVGRANFGAVTAEVAIAEIVGVDHDDVGRALRRGGEADAGARRGGHLQKAAARQQTAVHITR